MNYATKRMRALVAIIALTTIGTSPTAMADHKPATPNIAVTGEGRIDIAPDMAILSLTVTREAETAKAALASNSVAMREVLSAMRAEGISNKDLQTSDFSVQPKYSYSKPTANGERRAPKIVGYSIRNSLTVRVRNIESVGAILDKSISLGVNEGGQISFTNSDPSKSISQARELAVKNAIAKANTLASAAGVKTGEILTISEVTNSSRPVPMARSAMMMAEAADSVPLAGGENTYSVSVNISFAIEQ